MDVFKVGEVVVGQHFIFDTHRNGMEGEIVVGLHMGTIPHRITGTPIELGYGVRWADGDLRMAAPVNLRRRKPPTTGEESVLAMFKRAPQHEGLPA